MQTLRWDDFCQPDTKFHLARSYAKGKSPCRDHRQDFAEIFWVEKGTGLHRINGQQKKLEAGDLIWIRPEKDKHGFRCVNEAGFIFTNLAFTRSTADHLQERYFPGESTLFYSNEPLPVRHRLTPHHLSRLREWTSYLDRAKRTQLEVDRFLIDVLHRLEVAPAEPQDEALPDWLQAALHQFQDPSHFPDGVHALASLCNRTPEHVNATLKQHLGITATEAVNRARMDYAAGQLRISTKKILEICFDAGFENLGHFYKLFKARYGITPRTYRLRHLTAVGR